MEFQTDYLLLILLDPLDEDALKEASPIIFEAVNRKGEVRTCTDPLLIRLVTSE